MRTTEQAITISSNELAVPGKLRGKPIAGVLFRKYGTPAVFVLICLVFSVWTKGLFLQPDNLINVLRQISINAIIATGMTVVIISGGIDLSVGSLVALVGVCTAKLLGFSDLGPWLIIPLACLGGLLVGTVIGGINGLTVAHFRVPPFISTLAMMTAASGAAFILCDGRPVWNLPAEFNWLGRGYVLDQVIGSWLPVPVLIMGAVMIGAHLMLTRTTVGRYVYAIGGNEEASRLSGIDVRSIKLLVYAFSGFTAAVGGIILTSRLASGQPAGGASYELYAIAATVVGGTSLSGGEGSITGTLIGALIMGVLANGMNLAGVESYSQKVILGAIILGAVMLDRLRL